MERLVTHRKSKQRLPHCQGDQGRSAVDRRTLCRRDRQVARTVQAGDQGLPAGTRPGQDRTSTRWPQAQRSAAAVHLRTASVHMAELHERVPDRLTHRHPGRIHNLPKTSPRRRLDVGTSWDD